MIVADLDHFKTINDTHGHAAGDDVLRDVAYYMRKRLRAFDLAYRLGGEEFLILLPALTPTKQRFWPRTCAKRSVPNATPAWR